ncbi:uncharacterized protein LOC133798101 isoform X2 [Humulus lupulus]|uniref:uncharacterized protein LOC133798101 isoform X2 n=1 Tax=Humulus lupulus TaxID=3486 RepID=UPI002B40EB70|nr:uncharacterized protein LOC133798101 isoform X2 [Humulus lupulus]
MSTSEHRRSARIYELNAQRSQQTNSQNEDNQTCETAIEDLSTGDRDFNLKRGKKKVKTRSIQDLIMDTAAYQVGNSGNEDHHTNSVATSTGPGIDASKKSKLELLLSILKRRDSFEIFAEPVNPDEVNGYYDTIKEPMDFGTISRKLDGGSYKTLEEFEHDVFLVSNNAMVFNASTTVYYRQARAIKNLTQKLFFALKTEPENFESEISKMRLRGGRAIKREMEISNSGDQSNSRIILKGCEEERLGGEQNVNNWNLESFLNENKSIVRSIYESPEHLITTMETIPDNIRYNDSLAQFSKDIGSYAEIISGKKLHRCTSTEDLNHQFEVPNVASGHNSAVNRGHVHFGACGGEPIHVAQKHEIHLEISGPNFTGSNAYNTSNRYISNSINNDNVIQKTDLSSSYLKENLSYQKRKFSEFVRDEVKNSYQDGIPTSTWNTGSNDDVFISSSINKSNDNVFISSSINKSKNIQMIKASTSNPEQTLTDQREKLMDVMRKGNFCKTLSPSQREKIISSCIKHFHMAEAISSTPKSTLGGINFMEAIREGDNKLSQEAICSDSKKIPADQLEKFMDVVIEGESKSYRSESPQVSTTRYTSSNQEKMNFSMNKEKHFQMAEAASLKPKQFLVDPHREFFKSTNKEGNSSKNDISDQSIQCSNFSPALTDAGNLYFSGAESKQFIPSATSECKNVPMAAMNSVSMLETVGEIIGETTQSLSVGGNVFQEHMANQGTGNDFFSTHLLVGEDLCIVNPLNVCTNLIQFIPSMNNSVNVQMPESNGGNSIPTAMNEGMNVQTISTGPMTQGTLCATGHGVPPSAHQQLFSPPITESNCNQAPLIPSSDVNFPCGLNKLKTVGNGGQLLQVEQTWSWRQPMQLQSPPIVHSSMQMQPRPPLVDLANQTTPSQWQDQSASVYNKLMNFQPIPIFASSIQMQSMPHQVDLAGKTVSSQWRGQGTDVANEQVTQLHPPPISASPMQMQQKPNQVNSADQAAPSQG